MCLGNLARNVKTETQMAPAAVQRPSCHIRATGQWLEYAMSLTFWNLGPVVLHVDKHLVVRFVAADSNRRIGKTMFCGVTNQVRKHLANACTVPITQQYALRIEIECALRMKDGNLVNCQLTRIAHAHRRTRNGQALAELGACELE